MSRFSNWAALSPDALNQALQSLAAQGTALLVYRAVLTADLGQAYRTLLRTLAQPATPTAEADLLDAYGAWFYQVAATAGGWQHWIEQQILYGDNPFTQMAQRQSLTAMPIGLVRAAQQDLNLLQCWAQEGVSLITAAVGARTGVDLPSVTDLAPLGIEPSLVLSPFSDWSEALPVLVEHYQRQGVGIWGQFGALRWRAGHLEGIPNPDPVGLEDLVGYEGQKATLCQNTEALLAGQVALNVLLYGSRGSGKSALIKALLPAYRDRGLRLLELNKADMGDLPVVTERLRTSPLKFILFIDDLSFEEEEDGYKALKVVLEGNLTARPPNVAVYATSNRRHLIREFFGDRPRPSSADEVHAWDTVQEKLSLSDRFGLTLTFEPANQDTYLEIVRHWAQRRGVNLPADELTRQALQWAVRHNVRSGRTARQFIDYVKGQSQG